MKETINGFEAIICQANTTQVLFGILKMWKENFNIKFNFKLALTNEELRSSNTEKSFGLKNNHTQNIYVSLL